MKNKRLVGFLVFCATALIITLGASCAPKPTPSPTPPPAVTIIDDMGRSTRIEGIPQRVASLAPSITEILFALGLGDRIVATDDYSDYPEAAKSLPRVGSPFPGFNLEKLIAQEPQVVLSVRGGYVDSIAARGLKVVVLQPKDIEGVFKNIEMVGEIAGVQAKASELVSSLKQRRDAIAAKTAALSKPRVFYELDATEPTKPWTAGPGSFTHSLIELAGGQNIGASGASDYFQISAEQVISSDPEIILLEDVAYGITVESVKGRPGWGGIKAVTKGAVYPVDPDLTSRPGPRLIDGLEALARAIHPEAFQ
ncbi:MAG: cobalamin-binding protein [Chloroflexi bacterium]|nr:cobalamin-binding protein [Chloroflexota bacterium]